MADTFTPSDDETELVKNTARLLGVDHVVVCLGGLTAHVNGSPIFSCKVYGPFTGDEVDERAREILLIEGGGVFIRPLVDLADVYRRLSAD